MFVRGTPCLHILSSFPDRSFRYIQYLTAMKKTEESLRRLKKGKRTTFGIFQSSNTQDDDKDEERIQVQMMLDVEGLGQDAQSLGIEIRCVESYAQLIQMVRVEFGGMWFLRKIFWLMSPLEP